MVIRAERFGKRHGNVAVAGGAGGRRIGDRRPRRWSIFIRAELVFSVNPKPIPKKSPIGTSTLGSLSPSQ